jgi:hypothetical protein
LYEKILVARETPVVDVPTQCKFSHIDLPAQYTTDSPPDVTLDWSQLELFIEAASDQVETYAAQAMITEQVELTFDFWPGTQDPRNMLGMYQLGYAYNTAPWWFYGFPSVDSIELVRRPVLSGGGSPPLDPVITYNDPNGVKQTWDSSNYTVACDKICLNPGATWPLTDRKQDCIQITYWAGFGDDPPDVPARLKLATMYLAGWFFENRVHAGVEQTKEVIDTLSSLLSSYRSLRVPR